MNILKKIGVIAITGLTVVVFSCGGSAPQQQQKPVVEDQSSNYPDWFLNPPKAADAIFAIGIAQKATMQLSMDIATSSARDEVARVVGVKVSNMVKNFMEQAGVNEESQYTEFSSTVSKQIADNTISGSQRDKMYIDNTTTPHTVYVLVKLNLADMSGSIDALMKKQAAAYAQLRANKGFEDLANELKSMRGDDVETSKVMVD
jgi:hypothetical protein